VERFLGNFRRSYVYWHEGGVAGLPKPLLSALREDALPRHPLAMCMGSPTNNSCSTTVFCQWLMWWCILIKEKRQDNFRA